MDIPPSPTVESLAFGLQTLEMGGRDTFEEVLEGHDCPEEAPPYLAHLRLTHLHI